MTEKRFELVWYDNGERFEDNETGLSWLSSPYGRFHTLDKLNELAEENEQLKQQLRNSVKQIRKDVDRIFNLEEENKELKEELFDTRHQLDNIFKYRRQMEGVE